MARIEEGKAAANSLLEDKAAGHTKDIQKKLTPCLTSPYTVSYAVCLLGVLNVILVIVIIVLAVLVCSVRNTDERITITNEARNQNPVPCEDDWIWYQGKCYYFSKESDTWNNSQKFCISHNASLALIDNQEELNFLLWVKGLDNYWIGLRNTDDNKAWIWTNGTLYNERLFPVQRSSQENVECVFLNHDGVRSKTGAADYKWICTVK
ncbi:C-type lectin domain family 2 member A-like isoform X2 [Bufo bufo]|uniref:C-type lectin domain family 2 member A-like isoform X2 n=1 Tax=Bufo bufo TaxID=8384 RepID=UPI001ABEDBD9|nr:C-type lectin domain family 2 member A-like isoform X2 [Bufo bufo]